MCKCQNIFIIKPRQGTVRGNETVRFVTSYAIQTLFLPKTGVKHLKF